jgi:hypothetical protein
MTLMYARRWVDPDRQYRRWIDPRLSSVRVADVRAYLLRRGWKPVLPDRPHTLVFEEPPGDPEGPLYQFVPAEEQAPDYTRRMFDLVTGLAEFEDRYAVDVLNDILRGAGPPSANGQGQAGVGASVP